jgi:hypothetical protein
VRAVKYESSKPRKGEPITYRGALVGTVSSVDGNLCWVNYYRGEPAPFIWRFKDGLNNMHEWPSKQQKEETK